MNFLLHRKIAICMLFIALTGLGYVSYKQLPVELLPNAELPMLFVQVTSAQDMDPSYVESEVVIPIEGAIGTIGGVEQIESLIDSRQSSIKIDFKSNINFKITALKLQEKINEIASSLPEGFTVQVQKIDVSMLAGGFMSLQVRGSGGTDRVRNLVEKEIRPDLENIDGIASVNIYGGREKAIEVQLDPDACKALNLTVSTIVTSFPARIVLSPSLLVAVVWIEISFSYSSVKVPKSITRLFLDTTISNGGISSKPLLLSERNSSMM